MRIWEEIKDIKLQKIATNAIVGDHFASNVLAKYLEACGALSYSGRSSAGMISGQVNQCIREQGKRLKVS